MSRHLGGRRGMLLSALYEAACDLSLGNSVAVDQLQDLIRQATEEVDDPTIPLRGRILLGEAFVRLEEYGEAVPTLEEAVAGLREFGLRGFLAEAEALKALAHDALGQREEAIEAARSAVAFFDEQDVKSPQRDKLDRILSADSTGTGAADQDG